MKKLQKSTAGAMQVEAVVPPPLTAPLDERMLTGIVASGRTVEQPTGQVVFRCFDARGSALYRPIMKQFGPGQQVTLPESELCRLQELGFVETPGMVVRTEAEAAQLMGALIVDLKKDAADGEHARAGGRGASARVR